MKEIVLALKMHAMVNENNSTRIQVCNCDVTVLWMCDNGPYMYVYKCVSRNNEWLLVLPAGIIIMWRLLCGDSCLLGPRSWSLATLLSSSWGNRSLFSSTGFIISLSAYTAGSLIRPMILQVDGSVQWWVLKRWQVSGWQFKLFGKSGCAMKMFAESDNGD